MWLGAIDELWSLGKPRGQGFVWRESAVSAGATSDPILATGFDRKRVELVNHGTVDATVAIEGDPTCSGEWTRLTSVVVPANGTTSVALPDALPCYWLRAVSEKDAVLSVEFVYEGS